VKKDENSKSAILNFSAILDITKYLQVDFVHPSKYLFKTERLKIRLMQLDF
jgi:hypothetical protein